MLRHNKAAYQKEATLRLKHVEKFYEKLRLNALRKNE